MKRLEVSVPTKGTHLLYCYRRKVQHGGSRRFRPHEGDPSSLLLGSGRGGLVEKMFPSPRRGPIFSTRTEIRIRELIAFPSPRRGPIFSTLKKHGYNQTRMFPSPRRGPIFSTMEIVAMDGILKCFRPHEGDPSSLHFVTVGFVIYNGFRPHEGDPSSLQIAKFYNINTTPFPSPRRGPIFST